MKFFKIICFILIYMASIKAVYSAGIGYVVRGYGRAILESNKKILKKGDYIPNIATIFVYPESFITIKTYQGLHIKVVGYTKIKIEIFQSTENAFLLVYYGNVIVNFYRKASLSKNSHILYACY